jgi:histone-binding protein RBBP4
MTQAADENMEPQNEELQHDLKRKAASSSDDIDGEKLDEYDDVGAEEDEDEELDEDEQAIQDEYRLWKKNTPFLYDTVLTHCLTWPSLTCEWLPDKSEPPGSDYSIQKLVLGTQTADGTDNYLLIASVKLPKDDGEVDVGKYEESAQQENGGDQHRISIHSRICHPGEVNKARHNPKNPFIIATKTVSGDVLLFDYSKHPSRPATENLVLSQATLKGHSAEGYALDWSMDHQLASGADDNIVCIWDTRNGSCDSALASLVGHTKPVEAVAYNRVNQSVLLSVGDDRRILLWDLRTNQIAQKRLNGHEGDINAASWAPHTEFLFATAGGDKVINLWDSRRMDKPIYALEGGGHTADITNVNWSLFADHILASSGVDRRVILWDLSRIGDELTSDEAADGPPEVLMMHGGHTGRVNDFSWNPNEGMEWNIASVADDNMLQVWTVGENVWNTDSDDEAAE